MLEYIYEQMFIYNLNQRTYALLPKTSKDIKKPLIWISHTYQADQADQADPAQLSLWSTPPPGYSNRQRLAREGEEGGGPNKRRASQDRCQHHSRGDDSQLDPIQKTHHMHTWTCSVPPKNAWVTCS